MLLNQVDQDLKEETLKEILLEEEHCVRRDRGLEYYMAHLLVNQVDPIAKEDPAGDALMGVLKDDPVEAVVMEDPTDDLMEEEWYHKEPLESVDEERVAAVMVLEVLAVVKFGISRKESHLLTKPPRY